jgi:CHAT domain-containing protein
MRTTKWLVREHELTVLPSVSSLGTLRKVAPPAGADRPMIGFGNPLLSGSGPEDAADASKAAGKTACPAAPVQVAASPWGKQRGIRAIALSGGLADVAEIRMQLPLPETADELCGVARDLGVAPDNIYLGPRATETEVKRLSQTGELSRYRVIHFATHGALAGQVSGSGEPGLLLTPPQKASAADDGYLTATEIARLDLRADWVILPACNTAASGTQGGEVMSGMAQAFFYAGTRALLVSHWSVFSDATRKLITKALSNMAADKSVGRAEAMRRSMLDLIDKGTPLESHPAYWAPFIVVGEGAPT